MRKLTRERISISALVQVHSIDIHSRSGIRPSSAARVWVGRKGIGAASMVSDDMVTTESGSSRLRFRSSKLQLTCTIFRERRGTRVCDPKLFDVKIISADAREQGRVVAAGRVNLADVLVAAPQWSASSTSGEMTGLIHDVQVAPGVCVRLYLYQGTIDDLDTLPVARIASTAAMLRPAVVVVPELPPPPVPPLGTVARSTAESSAENEALLRAMEASRREHEEETQWRRSVNDALLQSSLAASSPPGRQQRRRTEGGSRDALEEAIARSLTPDIGGFGGKGGGGGSRSVGVLLPPPAPSHIHGSVGGRALWPDDDEVEPTGSEGRGQSQHDLDCAIARSLASADAAALHGTIAENELKAGILLSLDHARNEASREEEMISLGIAISLTNSQLKNTSSMIHDAVDGARDSHSVASWAAASRAIAGCWSCMRCTLINSAAEEVCGACGAAQPRGGGSGCARSGRSSGSGTALDDAGATLMSAAEMQLLRGGGSRGGRRNVSGKLSAKEQRKRDRLERSQQRVAVRKRDAISAPASSSRPAKSGAAAAPVSSSRAGRRATRQNKRAEQPAEPVIAPSDVSKLIDLPSEDEEEKEFMSDSRLPVLLPMEMPMMPDLPPMSSMGMPPLGMPGMPPPTTMGMPPMPSGGMPGVVAAVVAGKIRSEFRALHWEATDVASASKSVWSCVAAKRESGSAGTGEESDLVLSAEQTKRMASLFGRKSVAKAAGAFGKKKKKKKTTTTATSGGGSVNVFTVTDTGRRQNLGIGTRQFKKRFGSFKSLFAALLAPHRDVAVTDAGATVANETTLWLSGERLGLLSGMLPSCDDEMAMAKYFDAVPPGVAVPTPADPAAQLYLAAFQSEGGVSALRCAAATKIFAAEFTDAAAELQRRIALHVRAAREIMSSRALLRLLKEVLLIGNMMNASEEVGFSIGSLPALSQSKGLDGRTTLLDFVIEISLERDALTVAQAAADTQSLGEAQRFQRSDLASDLDELAKRRAAIAPQYASPAFITRVDAVLEKLQATQADADTLSNRLARYFARDSAKAEPELTFTLIDNFVTFARTSEVRLRRAKKARAVAERRKTSGKSAGRTGRKKRGKSKDEVRSERREREQEAEVRASEHSPHYGSGRARRPVDLREAVQVAVLPGREDELTLESSEGSSSAY